MASKFMRAALLGTALLGCSALTAPSFAQDAKTITGGFDVGPGGFQGNFNPMAATSGFTWLSIYFEPLVTYDAGLSKFVPSLASSWEVSADQKTYTFKLFEETWHDGEAFDSADVKFTIELNKNPDAASVLSARLKTVASVETPDPRTVVVTLSEPNAAFLDSLTKVLILPEHAVSKIPAAELSKNAWWSTSPVGTGPFKFTKYETDRFVELAADEDYRDGRPKVDRLINRYFESSAAAVAALRAGEIQFSYVETDDVPTFATDAAYKVIEGTSYVANYIGFNTEVALWKDLKVRQAVMHAIDRKAIIESLYKGAATEANCGFVVDRLVPQGIETFSYDPEKAKALLAEAGWDEVNGDKPIVWLTYYTNPLATNVMAAIQAMLAEVGINVVPRAVDTATYNGIILAKTPKAEDFPLVYAGLGNGPDPSSINIGLNETQIPPVGNNFLHIRVPELNTALDAALAETDDTKRDSRYQDVCKAMNAHLPWAPMWVTNRYGVASVKLKDFVWTPAPGGGPFDTDAEKWSLAE
jgi:peptide/nickel transport system substrate-binding protein